MRRVERDLARHRGPFRVGQRGRIELVAEDPEERHRGAHLDRRDPAGLVVRDRRDVRAHRAQRVGHRGPPLDLEALDRVGVVARPGLRRVGEHARVEPPATAGARLEQDVREGRGQAGIELVDAQDVAVEELALAIGREGEAVRLGDRPVHVPLDVRDRRAREELGQDAEEVVDDLRPREVEDELLAALGPGPARDPDRPVRMRLEQPASLADHLGLDPHPEAQAQRLDLPGEPVDAAGELAPVDDPVAERRIVGIPLAEPPVIEDEQLDPEVARGGRDLEQPGLVEVEVGRLPGVEQDRPRRVAPRPPREPLAIEAMERVAHRPQPGVRIHHDGLWGREGAARLERPGERVRADAEPDARRRERADLDLGEEVARVDEAEADRLAVRPRWWSGGGGR